ncbi:tyrosine-type recombinase/integrase [Micromonospora rifamycinica]|uniref:tyrosine-type recombinase/integrase n=1 Tax=Micromonospora rifamycinica TaxID=291594 RepID=UPI0034364E87
MRAGAFAPDTTVRHADKLLHRLHRELPEGLHGSTGDELAAWLAAGQATRRWSEQTVSTYYKHIVRFYRWASGGHDPWLSFDPSVELRRPIAHNGLPRPAGYDLVRAAIFDLPEPWRLTCRFVALAGLRPHEVARIRREDVTRDVITIKGKGGRTRAIPTHPLIWQSVWSRPPGLLVCRPDGGPADAEYISKGGAYRLRRAGLASTLYPLRHFFGTVIQERYRDLRVTQELMGHASPITTGGYTQVTSERMREAVAMLPFSDDAGTGAGAGAGPHPWSSAPGVDVRPPLPRSEASGRAGAGRGQRRRPHRRVRP